MSARRPPLLKNSPAMRRILASLQTGDLSAIEISIRAHVAITTLTDGCHLKAMREQGHIHICEWRRPNAEGRLAPIYRAGPGTDAPQPNAPGTGKAAILRALQTDHLTAAAMTERFKVSSKTVWRHLKELHAAREVHICGYRKEGASTVYAAVYAIGEGEDAPAPEERYTRRVRAEQAKAGTASPRALTLAGLLGV